MKEVASNRRVELTPEGKVGRMRGSSCKIEGLIQLPEGLIDRVVSLLSFWNGDKPVAAMTYYATHPQSYYGQGLVNWDFVGMARRCILDCGIDPGRIELEITESLLMQEGLLESLRSLKQLGVKLSIDDFGTGYASLTHLLTVPVDILKIDKSFIARLAPGDASMAIVEGLIQIAGKLDMRVIAEGVETEDQVRELISAGCLLGQGYLFSEAVDRVATTALLLGGAQRLSASPIRPAGRIKHKVHEISR